MRAVLIGSVLAAALAGLLFGFDTAVIAGVTSQVRALYGLSHAGLGVTVSAALWGTLVGALTAGWPGDRYGSRDSLRLMALLYLVSGLGCALAWNWSSLVVFRFVGGLGIGGSSVLAPVYISEIAPPRRRGALVGLFQFMIVLGILLAYASNFLIGAAHLGAAEWRWKLGVTAAPAALLLAMLYLIPNSPRWLVARGRMAEAVEALRRIGAEDPAAEAAAIRSAHAAEPEVAATRLSWRLHRKPILLAFGVAAFNQLSGINAILYYLNDIFAAAGFGKTSADLQAVIIGAMNLVFTLVGMWAIDRLGRKTLLLIGAAGTGAALAATCAIMASGQGQTLLLWALVGFIAFFALSQGAVIWVYISEIFPSRVRARGQSVGSSTHWLMNALISGVFPVVAGWSKAAPFGFFAGMMALQLVVVLAAFPETKGVPLEEMGERLG